MGQSPMRSAARIATAWHPSVSTAMLFVLGLSLSCAYRDTANKILTAPAGTQEVREAQAIDLHDAPTSCCCAQCTGTQIPVTTTHLTKSELLHAGGHPDNPCCCRVCKPGEDPINRRSTV